MDTRYDYKNTVAVKLLIQFGDSLLLAREPETNAWMPNRLALPGGKPFLGESLDETNRRKMVTEAGISPKEPEFVAVYNILQDDSTIYHVIYHVVVDTDQISSDTESNDVSWYNLSDISALSPDNFAEFYMKDFMTRFLSGEKISKPVLMQDNRSGDALAWLNTAKAS